MKDVLDALEKVFGDVQNGIITAAEKLPAPEVTPLTRRSASQTVAAVAVDAGQSLFKGVLREAGITLIRVSSSWRDETPLTVPFWFNPFLDDDARRQQIESQIDTIVQQPSFISESLTSLISHMGWQTQLPSQAYNTAENALNFVRDLLEWATLAHVAQRLRDQLQTHPDATQGLVLRDGALRFAHFSESASQRLSDLFQGIGVPILGFVKRSPLLRHPLLHYWLLLHRAETLDRPEPFVVWIGDDLFAQAGYRLERYFGQQGQQGKQVRWGRYALVRLDAQPGSRHFFLVDIPLYLYPNREQVVVLLSNLIIQRGATAFPWPGYPVPLAEAHRKVRLDDQTARLFESVLRTRLDQDAATLWRIFLALMSYPERQE